MATTVTPLALKECAKKLALPTEEEGFDYNDIFKINGNNGHSGNEIYKRQRKIITEKVSRGTKECSNFGALSELGVI